MIDMRPAPIACEYSRNENVFTYSDSPRYVMPPLPIAGYSSYWTTYSSIMPEPPEPSEPPEPPEPSASLAAVCASTRLNVQALECVNSGSGPPESSSSMIS